METFDIRELSFSYPGRAEKAVDRFSLKVGRGEFVVLCGPSGCGKSTLLRQLKPVLAPHGRREGEILFEGAPLDSLDRRSQCERIGFVRQSPENQIVTDKVWHELAFGLESLGCGAAVIRRRVAEMACFFGMESWFYRDVAELSGGQKQLLNLAAAMVMQPAALVLDEPTSQLDPIAAAEFLAALGRINRELGTTILLSEHRLEEAFALADAVAVMDRGKLLCSGSPSQVGEALRRSGHPMFRAMPAAMGVWAAVGGDPPCPVTVREGRDWLGGFAAGHPLRPLPPERRDPSGEPAVRARELWFRYEKDAPDTVRGLSLDVNRGELLALLGGNGAGKTTALRLLAGLLKPNRGRVEVTGRVGVLPQNPQTLFVKKTVREDLFELLGDGESEDARERVGRVVRLCRLQELLDRHPYDLSGGEQQRAALAKVLLPDPDVLLLDEPTKGLDAEFKRLFAGILHTLLHRGTAILMVSHDVEFCARHAHRCALLFDGAVAAGGTPREFFSGNSFYTTPANRMARALLPEAVTPEDIIAACGGEPPPDPELPEDGGAVPPPPPAGEESRGPSPGRLPWWRGLLAAVSGLAALLLFLQIAGVLDLSAVVGARLLRKQLPLLIAMVICLFVLAFSTARPSRRPGGWAQPPREKRNLSRRTLMAAGLILLLIPLTLFVGQAYLGGRKYYAISLLILLETMLPFFLIFEGRRPQPRELTVIAVLCALGVAGRAAFFMLPQFKPVLALTILTGVAFGGETGFLVGAVTMLTSNMLFSQGPWTPWQMFAVGMVGLLSGVLFRKGWLRRSRASLCVFGALVSVVVFGGIMNTSSAILSGAALTWPVVLSYWAVGFPADCVQAAATWLFLWFAAEPFLEKLERVKVKYGLGE